MSYYIYFLSNVNNTALYIGRAENLADRVKQHKLKLIEGFTKKYNVDKLVYYEIYDDKETVAKREWQLKKWKRGWKDDLINQKNPGWNDLYDDLIKLIA